MISFRAFSDELQKIASGTYRSFFTGEIREDATFFPPGTMTRSARHIYEIGKDPKYAPAGPVSSIRWINYYLNRGGKNIPENRKKELEKARLMLSRYNSKLKKKKD